MILLMHENNRLVKEEHIEPMAREAISLNAEDINSEILVWFDFNQVAVMRTFIKIAKEMNHPPSQVKVKIRSTVCPLMNQDYEVSDIPRVKSLFEQSAGMPYTEWP